MALAPLSSPLREQLGLGPSEKGVYVAAVTPGSPADESRVASGDVIVRVGNRAVTTPSQVSTAIRAAEGRKSAAIPLLATRDGTPAYLAEGGVRSGGPAPRSRAVPSSLFNRRAGGGPAPCRRRALARPVVRPGG